MDPFSLPGPAFLAFYAALAAAAILVQRALRNQRESGAPPRLGDPYLAAGARGGPEEIVRVAIVALHERGWIESSGQHIVAAKGVQPGDAKETVERLVLDSVRATRREANLVARSVARLAEMRSYHTRLEALGLIPARGQRIARLRDMTAAVLLLWTVAIVKIDIAQSAGRTNYNLLLVFAVGAAIASAGVAAARRTRLGDEAVAGMRRLFSGQRGNTGEPAAGTSSSPSTNLVWMAGALGVGAASAVAYPQLHAMFPGAAKRARQDGVDASCGSSCGSGESGCGASSGGDSSGGDGGGGGGGGCGGCGGSS